MPPGFDSLPPAQMLCRIRFWDGTDTRLWYLDGQVGRVENPGSEITDYVWTDLKTLGGVRNSLASDWLAADLSRSNNDDVFTLVGYTWADPDPMRKATSLSSPMSAPGDATRPRVVHTYRYEPSNKQSFVDITGLTPATGFASKITYDDACAHCRQQMPLAR